MRDELIYDRARALFFRRAAGIGVLLAAIFLVPLFADARVLYVDRSTGSDSTTYANNSATTPWATIGRAAWGSTSRTSPNANEAARPGDTVIVRAGTYNVTGTGERYIPAYTPANSGTASNPIVFQAEGIVNLTQSGRGPVIGAYNKNYITWRGFRINEAQAPVEGDTGPVVVWLCTGCVIDGNTVIGDPNMQMPDNHPGIRIEWSSRITVSNNFVSGWYCVVVNYNNGAAIQVYMSDGLVIEHNEITDSGSGIFLKGLYHDGPPIWAPQLDYTIRYNLVYGVETGIAVHVAPARPEAPIRIYQNVVRDTQTCLRIWPFSSSEREPKNAKIVNNTFARCDGAALYVSGDLIANAGHVFWNNIASNTNQVPMWFDRTGAETKAKFDSEHNIFWTFGGAFAYNGGGTYSLATWKSSLRQDTANPASASVDPRFVNAAANDFRLQTSSPARTMGVDFLDLNGNGSTTDIVPIGAYVTGNETIGRTSGSSNPSTPAAPTGLRIIP